MRILPQPFQEQERGGTPSKFPPPSSPLVVVRSPIWLFSSISHLPTRPNEATLVATVGKISPERNLVALSKWAPNRSGDRAGLEVRIMHLQEMHKFGECNHAKKFFRADHFRQHLKHSHAGTSGKWTNMLENACMQDEPLPEPLGGLRGKPEVQE